MHVEFSNVKPDGKHSYR